MSIVYVRFSHFLKFESVISKTPLPFCPKKSTVWKIHTSLEIHCCFDVPGDIDISV